MKIDVKAKIRIIHDNSGTEVQNDFSQFVSGDFYMILKEYQVWKPYPRDKFMLLLEDCLTGKYHSDSSVHPLNNITARLERPESILRTGYSIPNSGIGIESETHENRRFQGI